MKQVHLLLGDHLHEKSVTVQWVSVAMPKDRKRRLKKYSDVQQLAATDPDLRMSIVTIFTTPIILRGLQHLKMSVSMIL